MKADIVNVSQFKLVTICISHIPHVYLAYLQHPSVVIYFEFIQLCDEIKGDCSQYGMLHMQFIQIVGQ